MYDVGFFVCLSACLFHWQSCLCQWASWGCFCLVSVHCEASDWGPWSPCMKKGKTCGFKRGTETRVREILQHPSAKGNLCPPTSETRTCIVQRKKCSKGERGTDTLTKWASLSPHNLMHISLYNFIWDIWQYSSYKISKMCRKRPLWLQVTDYRYDIFLVWNLISEL